MKDISVALYRRNFLREDWTYDVDPDRIAAAIEALAGELEPLGFRLTYVGEEDVDIEVNGYGDLLNAIRLRAPFAGFPNACLGHIIGASAECDLLADIRRGVNRVAFAPETILPEESNRKTCHNCGCGC